MCDRAITPVLGAIAIVGVAVLLAASVAMMAGGLATPDAAPDARFAGTFDPATAELTIRHAGGDPLASDAIALRIHVDDEPLAHQPPVPFFAARGFGSGPTGPFNPAGDDTWAAGDRGTLRIASTNDPIPTANSSVTVAVIAGDHVIGVVELDAT